MDNTFKEVEDFVADESFQNYCLNRPDADQKRWSSYIQDHPEQAEVIEMASSLVKMLNPHTEEILEIVSEEKLVPENSLSRFFSLPYLRIIAASFALLASVFAVYQFTKSDNSFAIVEKHAAEQNISIMLSDQSEVNLREGASIKFLESWEKSKSRKVDLIGEAYFDIKKAKRKNKPFIVNLPNGKIEVLGTKFLVKSDSLESLVSLEEGRVNFYVGARSFELSPGDVLKFNEEKVSITKNMDTRTYDSWRRAKLSFKDTPIQDIVSVLQNSFDLEVLIQNKSLADRKITAQVNNNDPQLLLKAIAEIYNLELKIEGSKIILK